MDNGKKVTNLDGFKDSMFLLGTAKCHPPIRVQQNNASVPIPTPIHSSTLMQCGP